MQGCAGLSVYTLIRSPSRALMRTVEVLNWSAFPLFFCAQKQCIHWIQFEYSVRSFLFFLCIRVLGHIQKSFFCPVSFETFLQSSRYKFIGLFFSKRIEDVVISGGQIGVSKLHSDCVNRHVVGIEHAKRHKYSPYHDSWCGIINLVAFTWNNAKVSATLTLL